MIATKQKYEIIDEIDGEAIIKKIEWCGRVCYKSESKITDNSARAFVRNIIERGHESVLEHVSITVRFITDRATSHQLVRYRLASYSQESQRYVKYAGRDIEFIKPLAIRDNSDECCIWRMACQDAEKRYNELIENGMPPQVARAVLPNCTKTEIVQTANLREWRHVLRQRTSKAAQPEIRELMLGLLNEFKAKIPVVFDDIEG